MRRRILLGSQQPTPQAYLRVEPTEVQWIDVGMPVEYRVMSNIGWIVR
jgi:hypothetical protein